MNLDELKHRIRGPVPLALPPFRDDLSLDTREHARQVRHMVEGGLGSGGRGVLICPSGTGEYVTLDNDEHRAMVETAVEAAAGAFPIVAGVGTTDIRRAIALARQAMAAGADCIMLSPPFYYSLDVDSYELWVRGVLDAVDAPIMLYTQPWRADLRAGLSYEQAASFARIPNVISIKYGSPGVFYEMVPILRDFGERFAFIDNSLGATAAIGHIHGSSGYIAGPAAWWPEFELRFWDLLEAGDYRAAEAHHARLAPYMAFFMGDEFPGSDYPHYFGSAVIKATYEYVGLYGGPVRPPFKALTAAQKQELFAILERVGVPRAAAVPA